MPIYRILQFSCIVLLVTGTLAQAGPGQRGGSGDRSREGKRRQRDDNALKIGDAAPALRLKTLDGQKKVSVLAAEARKPVILFFGSYT